MPDNQGDELREEVLTYLKRLRARGVRSIYAGDSAGESTDDKSGAKGSKRKRGAKDADAAAATAAQATSATATNAAPTTEAAPPGGAATTSTFTKTPSRAATAKNRPSRPKKGEKTVHVTDKVGELAVVAEEVAGCTQCALHEGRTNTVFGTGSPDTRVMFIGEGPGRDEDMQGKPFVGRSGQLLTKMIAAIDLTRDDVYIANIVKCRPPNNRDPQEDEVRCCESYLKRQIAIIQPRIICALGRVSAHWLLKTNAALGQLRNSDNTYEGIPVLVTYHPAALLRNPNLKRGAWDDFKKLRAVVQD